MRKIWFILMAVVAFSLIGAAVSMAEEKADAEWSPNSVGPVTAWVAPLCDAKTGYVIPRFYFTNFRKQYDNSGNKESIGDDTKQAQQQQMIFAAYGLTSKLELDAQISLVENHATIGDQSASSTGWADSYLYLRYCLAPEQDNTPCITGMLQLKLPTGKYQDAAADKLGTDIIGTGSTDLGVGIVATKKIKPVILHGDLSVFHPFKATVDSVKIQYGNYVNYDLAAEYFLNNGINFMAELNGLWQGKEEDDGVTIDETDVTYLQLAPGIGYGNEKFAALLAYQLPLSGKNTVINETWVLNFLFSF